MILFSRSISSLIKMRTSCRTFDSRTVDDEKKNDIQKFINISSNETFRFQLIEKATGSEQKKLGTYGVISNGNLFIAGITKKSANLFEFGAVLETLVLYASDLGLGTCWIGGSFDRKTFSDQLSIGKDEFVPVVIAVGYPASRRRLLEKIMRLFVRSDKRKEWDQLFFSEGFNRPLAASTTGNYRPALEALRLAPSANNKQPWRVLADDKGFHFYLNRSKGFSRYEYDMQMIDMGIGFSHFALVARENHNHGIFSEEYPLVSPGYEYVKSWIIHRF
jgi:nitroreductase